MNLKTLVWLAAISYTLLIGGSLLLYRLLVIYPTIEETALNFRKNNISALVACDTNAFTTSNTNTLISALKSQGTCCINELFSADAGTQAAVYTSTKMIAVANHVQSLSSAYGGNGDVDIQALFLFLRAGYYVEFYNNNVSFSASVKPAVKAAIDAFVNNSHFYGFRLNSFIIRSIIVFLRIITGIKVTACIRNVRKLRTTVKYLIAACIPN